MLEPLFLFQIGLFDLFGIIGALLYVCNYTLLVARRINPEHAGYFSINLVAATLLLVSLFHAFNLGAALLQLFFMFMSVVGILSRLHPLWRWRRMRRRPVPAPQPIRWTRPGLAAKQSRA